MNSKSEVKVGKNFLIFLISFLCLMFMVVSCSQKPEKSKKAIKVYTSLYPLEHFTKWIIPDAEIQSIIPFGVDPHNFEPSLKDIQKLYTANVIIYIGNTDVDRWIDKLKNELIQKGVKVIRLQDYLIFKKYPSGNEIDPHVWLDPLYTKEVLKVIRNTVQEIVQLRKIVYEKNLLTYESSLNELDKAYKETLSNCFHKDVIVTHEFLNYLTARYGFSSHFIVHNPEEEPSLKRLKQLKDFMKKKSIEYIVSEPEGEKIARGLSEETGAKILQFNTFHIKSNKDYFQTMQENLKTLKTALKCNK